MTYKICSIHTQTYGPFFQNEIFNKPYYMIYILSDNNNNNN